MGRVVVNRAGEMEVFVRVVEQGSFSAASRACRMTPSAVSKLIGRLEARLGARLLHRSTRALQLTPEGCAFYERASRILRDLDEAERHAGAGEEPVGRVRINTSASYATHVLAPILPELLDAHPNLAVDLVQTDAVVDLLAERADVAVRAGALRSSSLVARKLGETGMMIVAAPAYLHRRGEPRVPQDLGAHDRIGLSYSRAIDGWPMLIGGETRILPTSARTQASDGEALRQLALRGAGLARLAAFTVAEDVQTGHLVPLLEAFNPGDREVFHAIHVGPGGAMPARVRAVLDFLARRGRISSPGV